MPLTRATLSVSFLLSQTTFPFAASIKYYTPDPSVHTLSHNSLLQLQTNDTHARFWRCTLLFRLLVLPLLNLHLFTFCLDISHLDPGRVQASRALKVKHASAAAKFDLHVRMCVRVCMCVRARVRACVRNLLKKTMPLLPDQN